MEREMPRLAKKPKSKLMPLNLKVPKEVRKRLEQQAQSSSRSLTQEVIHLLLSSLEADDAVERAMGGKEMFGLFRAMSGVAASIEDRIGSQWSDDYQTFLAVRQSWHYLIDQYRPRGDPDLLQNLFGPQPEDPGKAPELPQRPSFRFYNKLLAMALQDSPEARAEFETAQQRYDHEAKEWQQKVQQSEAYFKKASRHFEDLKNIGRETAAGWTLPERKTETR